MQVDVSCPYCGQPLTLEVDETGGRQQTYIEDCAVCCQPIEVRASVGPEEFDVKIRRADE
jgi:Cysteine-rich CPXCG